MYPKKNTFCHSSTITVYTHLLSFSYLLLLFFFFFSTVACLKAMAFMVLGF